MRMNPGKIFSMVSLRIIFRAVSLVVICLFSPGVFSADATDTSGSEIAQAADAPVEKPPEITIKDVVEHAAQQAAEKAVQKSANTAVEQAATKVVEKAAAQETAKEVIKATRPEDWKGPTRVTFRVFVLDIDQIDDANENFTANVYVVLNWQDSRLASSEDAIREIHLESVWNPQVLLANQQGQMSLSLPETVQVYPDGTVYYRQRYTGKLSQPLKLEDFPMDRHWFSIQFTSAAYNSDELEFVPGVADVDADIIGGTMADQLSLPDWKILGHEAKSAPYEPINEIRQAGFVFRFQAERYVTYYLWQILLPLTMVVVMSWAGFWVQRKEVGVRIGVATSSILTLIAQRFVLASLLPRLPYMTRLDYFTVGCTLLVFLALIGVVLSSYLSSSTVNRDLLARDIDQVARPTFPLVFAILFIWFLYR
jgi:hypothetical protein